jgi:hypothetical protein
LITSFLETPIPSEYGIMETGMNIHIPLPKPTMSILLNSLLIFAVTNLKKF